MLTTDIAIVGAGPIGVELAIALRKHGAEYLQFEAGAVGQTIADWPRLTRFLSDPIAVSLAGAPAGGAMQERLTKEEYLAYLRNLVVQFDLPICEFERVAAIRKTAPGFLLETQRHGGRRQVAARRVVLAVGDMAGPHRIGVPGEDLPHVRHDFDDLHSCFRRRVVVVGGKNSALEAVLRLHYMHTATTLACIEPDIGLERNSHKLAPLAADLVAKGAIDFLPAHVPTGIDAEGIDFAPCDAAGQPVEGPAVRREADVVLLLTGYDADRTLFDQAGCAFDPDTGRVVFDETTMETTTAGLYVAGTASAVGQAGHGEFIETSHVHVRRIVRSLGLDGGIDPADHSRYTGPI